MKISLVFLNWQNKVTSSDNNNQEEAQTEWQKQIKREWSKAGSSGETSSLDLHLKGSLLMRPAFFPQIKKALSKVRATWSCSLSPGSRSSTQVISWVRRWRSSRRLPVDWVSALAMLSERTRPMVPNRCRISSIVAQATGAWLNNWEDSQLGPDGQSVPYFGFSNSEVYRS